MVKNSAKEPGLKQAALVGLGWTCFVLGALTPELLIKVPFLALARVLP
ncbi:hypothetical protein [Acidithiobacillus sp.]